jgi:hypothetical protein
MRTQCLITWYDDYYLFWLGYSDKAYLEPSPATCCNQVIPYLLIQIKIDLYLVSMQIVEQESLVPVERMDRPCVICVAAWFGKVRLIDNIEIQSTSSDR